MDPVTHFEIPARNLDDAARFYREVFGWQFHALPDIDYVIVNTTPVDDQHVPKAPGTINGGMLRPGTPGSDHPVVVIAVDDIERKVRAVEESGGRLVHGITDVADFGRYARVSDPEGHIIGLYQATPTAP